MQFEELVTTRRSVKTYDPKHSIGDDELSALFEKVALSPSSFNLQFWRFVVVRDAETRAKLREASWNQEHVGTCSAVIVVAGKLTAYKDAAEIFAESPENVREALLPTIAGFYENNPQAQREEAIRSTSATSLPYFGAPRSSICLTGSYPSKFARSASSSSSGVILRSSNTSLRIAISESAALAVPSMQIEW